MKRILIILAAVLLLAQFIRPARSKYTVDPSNDLLAMTKAPAEVAALVRGACYDCHGDEPEYPWYASITPINFIVQHHMDEGREHVNFSRWGNGGDGESGKECADLIVEEKMPPQYYRLMHGHGRLSEEERHMVTEWFRTVGGGHKKESRH